jgi:hypothetical protein
MVTDDKMPPSAVTNGSSALPKVKNWVSTVPTSLDMGGLFSSRRGAFEFRNVLGVAEDIRGGLVERHRPGKSHGIGGGSPVAADGFELHKENWERRPE